MVTVNNYYNNIPVGRDLNNLPNTSSAGTTVGYQYDGLTEEDRFVQKVLQEHYDKVYKENLSHSDPMAYIESKYCDVTSPNFCSYMTEDQRSIAYRNEKRMLQTGGKYSAGFARYDYALRNYKDVYTGASRSIGYIRNTDKEKQYARSVVNQQISNLFSKNGISLSKQADLTFSIDPYTYQLTVSGNADRDTLSQMEKLLNEDSKFSCLETNAALVINAMTNAGIAIDPNKEVVNMCEAIRQMVDEGIMLGEKRGEERGEKRGEMQKTLAIARRMLEKNYPIEQVVDLTMLTKQEVEELSKTIKQ